MCSRFVFVSLSFLLVVGLETHGWANIITHEVIIGESLSEIAKRYQVTPQQIRKANKLKRNYLRPGQKLRIKTSKASRSRLRGRYRIKAGDTPTRVAKKHKMPLRLLNRLNPTIKKKPLHVGQLLWVVKEGPRQSEKNGRRLEQLQSNPGITVLEARRAWGTPLAIRHLNEVLLSHALRYPEAHHILIGDISREGGGYLPPHRSHRSGRDVDIRYPLKKYNPRYVNATCATLDVARTWDLIQRFIDTGDVVYVFVDYRLQRVLYEHARSLRLTKATLKEYFQYPRSRRSMSGIIRHEKGHRAHFHVRFRKRSRQDLPTS